MAASQSGAKSSSKKLVVAGIGVALALGIGAVGVMSLGSKTTEAPPKAAATGAPAPVTAAAKVETPAAVTMATPSDTSGTKLSLDDMPNAGDDAKTDDAKPVRSGRGGARAAGTASAKPTATAAATAPPVATATTKPTATAANPNVPAVTDPGF